jgi:hypothetical protein
VDGETPLEKLEALKVRGILWQLAKDGQIIDASILRSTMPVSSQVDRNLSS